MKREAQPASLVESQGCCSPHPSCFNCSNPRQPRPRRLFLFLRSILILISIISLCLLSAPLHTRCCLCVSGLPHTLRPSLSSLCLCQCQWPTIEVRPLLNCPASAHGIVVDLAPLHSNTLIPRPQHSHRHVQEPYIIRRRSRKHSILTTALAGLTHRPRSF